jgi:ATP-dependent helicase YprA (DUF1998 family)
MLDPIGGFERIKDFFISYIETAFRISDAETAEARHALLLEAGSLTTTPFIEPVLRYKSNPRPLEEVIREAQMSSLSEPGKVAFVELALSGLFDGEPCDGPIKRRSKFNPYVHQVDMLLRGIRPGHPGIVTSGTGSGNTESFMLPVLATIAKEAVAWVPPDPGYLKGCWWENGSYKPQREHDTISISE